MLGITAVVIFTYYMGLLETKLRLVKVILGQRMCSLTNRGCRLMQGYYPVGWSTGKTQTQLRSEVLEHNPGLCHAFQCGY